MPSTNFACSELDISLVTVSPVATLLVSKLPAYGILIDLKILRDDFICVQRGLAQGQISRHGSAAGNEVVLGNTIFVVGNYLGIFKRNAPFSE